MIGMEINEFERSLLLSCGGCLTQYIYNMLYNQVPYPYMGGFFFSGIIRVLRGKAGGGGLDTTPQRDVYIHTIESVQILGAQDWINAG